jgi:hypothetical protein
MIQTVNKAIDSPGFASHLFGSSLLLLTLFKVCHGGVGVLHALLCWAWISDPTEIRDRSSKFAESDTGLVSVKPLVDSIAQSNPGRVLRADHTRRIFTFKTWLGAHGNMAQCTRFLRYDV